jgi:hypothetical protein
MSGTRRIATVVRHDEYFRRTLLGGTLGVAAVGALGPPASAAADDTVAQWIRRNAVPLGDLGRGSPGWARACTTRRSSPAYDAIDQYVARHAPDRLDELRRNLRPLEPNTTNMGDYVWWYWREVKDKAP